MELMTNQKPWISEPRSFNDGGNSIGTKTTPVMSSTTVTTETGMEVDVGPIKPLTTVKAPKKLKPARKQVKPGQVKKEEPVQTGKEYS